METGKILAPFRILLGLDPSRSTRDRDPQQGGHGHARRYPNRRPTKEEAEKVQKWLGLQEAVQKNGLQVTCASRGDIFTILICDFSGKVLKTLLGDEIFRLLEDAEAAADQASRGSILDRRI